VDIRNSQRRSPRSSAKSKQDSSETPSERPLSEAEEKQFMDFSGDHVARVRAAKAAAQREMESFGDPSEYDVVILQGQLKEGPSTAPSQGSLNFQNTAPNEPGESD